MPKLSKMAALLVSACKAVIGAINRAEGPVVLLGRDLWPVASALRAIAIRVQYFCWSRVTDVVTAAEAWRAEVPCGAVVIDSGFSGSIIDEIRRHGCRSVRGVLLSTVGRYPKSGPLPRTAVLDLEDWPKPTGRCLRYSRRPGGLFVAEFGDAQDDSGEVSLDEARRSMEWVEEAAKALAEITGRKLVSRPKLLLGITPEERIGLSGDALRRHMDYCRRSHRVRSGRRKKWGWSVWRQGGQSRWTGCQLVASGGQGRTQLPTNVPGWDGPHAPAPTAINWGAWQAASQWARQWWLEQAGQWGLVGEESLADHCYLGLDVEKAWLRPRASLSIDGDGRVVVNDIAACHAVGGYPKVYKISGCSLAEAAEEGLLKAVELLWDKEELYHRVSAVDDALKELARIVCDRLGAELVVPKLQVIPGENYTRYDAEIEIWISGIGSGKVTLRGYQDGPHRDWTEICAFGPILIGGHKFAQVDLPLEVAVSNDEFIEDFVGRLGVE